MILSTARVRVALFLATAGLSLLPVTASAQTISVSPAPIVFGAVVVGNTATQSPVVTVPSGDNVTAKLTTGTAFTLTPASCTPPTTTCAFQLNFLPTAFANYSDTLTVTDTVTGQSTTAAVTGTGGAAVISLTPNPLNFPAQPYKTTSAPQVATLANTGTAPMYFAVGVSGANKADFVYSTNCVSPLPIGGSCNYNITFTPTLVGTETFTLTVQSASGANHTTLVSNLVVNGTSSGGPTVAISPAALAFDPTTIGGSSPVYIITITNTGTLAATPGNASVTQSAQLFPINSIYNTCRGALNPGASCVTGLQFTPTKSGPSFGTLSLQINEIAQPFLVPLTGTGVTVANPQNVPLSPTTHTYLSQTLNTQGTMTSTLTNLTGAPLPINYTSLIGGTNGSAFAFSTACPQTLAVNASCTITSTFTPYLTGLATASLLINVGSSTTLTLPLAGYGVTGTVPSPGPLPTLNPNTLTFPTQVEYHKSGPVPVTLTNNATTPLTLYDGQVFGNPTGAFLFENTGCTAALAPGASCTFSVYFISQNTGVFTGTLAVDTSAGSVTLPLAGTGVASVVSFSLSATSLAFGVQNVGTSSSPQVVTLTNNGNAAGETGLTDGNPTVFPFTTTCGSTLAPSASCTISVLYTPNAVGPQYMNFTIGGINGTTGFSATGTGYAPGVPLPTFSPSPITFPTQNAGTTITTGLNLTNNSSVAITLNSNSITGATPSFFTDFSSNCLPTLAAYASCNITVYFSPASSTTAYSALLNYTTGAGTVTVPLSGPIKAPSLSISPASITFGPQAVATASSPQMLTISNIGSSTATVGAPSVTGDFSVQSDNCTSLAAGASCAIGVIYSPTTTGSATSTLTVRETTTNTTASVSLSGTGTANATTPLALSPTSLTFPSEIVGGNYAGMTTTLTNTTGAPLALNFGTISPGTNGTEFTSSANCPSPLAAGANCVFSVFFEPTVVGSASATLIVSVGSPAQMLTAPLSGTGVAANTPAGPALAFSPTTLSFPAQTVGTTSTALTATLFNTSASPVTITFGSLATGGNSSSGSDGFAYTTACASPLAAGASCTFSVTYTPTVVGQVSNTLLVGTTENASTYKLPLSGSGIAAPPTVAATFNPTSLTFPAQSLGTSSSAQTATFTNTGTAPLTINYGSLATGGNSSGGFAYTAVCNSPLAVGASCTFSVAFNPTSTGTTSNMLIVGTGAGNFTLPLSGTGVSGSGTTGAGQATMSPVTITFPAHTVGTTSPAMTTTLTNTGNGPLSIYFGSLTGSKASDFAFSADCPSPMAVGASCTFTVTNTPSTLGTEAATLIVSTSDPNSPATVQLTGTGTQ